MIRTESERSRFLSGTIWNSLGSAMFGLNSFILLTLVSRTNSVETVGSFSISFTTAQLLFIVGLFGVNNYQMTDFKERFSFHTYFWLKIFSSGLMVLICVAVIIFNHGKYDAQKNIFLLLLTAFMVLNSIGELYQSLFFQKKRLDLSGQALFFRTFFSSLSFAAVLIFVKNATIALIIMVAINLVCTWFWDVRLKGRFVPYKSYKNAFDLTEIKRLATDCFPLFVSVFLMNLIINCQKYVIDFIMDDTAQGYYNMIFIPAQVINLCSQFIFKPLLSSYAELLEKAQVKIFLKRLFRQALFISAISVLASICIYFLGPTVFEWFYKKNLYNLRAEMAIVIIGGGIFALCQMTYYVLIIMRRQKQILLIYIISTVISLACSLLFTYLFGITGACISFAVSHIALILIYVYFIMKNLRNIKSEGKGDNS